MSVYPWVIVGTDGSPTATQAVLRAAALAAGLSAPLLVAAAFSPTRLEDLGPPSVRAKMPGEGWAGVAYRAASDVVQDAAALAARATEVQVETAVPEGEPAAALLDLAASRTGSLLVVGSQGMTATGRSLLGNVPNKVTHHAAGDVLIVCTGRDVGGVPPSRLLIATDGSRSARRAVERGLEIAAVLEAHVLLLTADRDPQRGSEVLATAGKEADAAGVVWRADVAGTAPADAILDAAPGHDLVVMGSKGMTGPTRFLLGSVPNKVSHHITTDLLIVGTDDA